MFNVFGDADAHPDRPWVHVYFNRVNLKLKKEPSSE